MYLTPAAAPGPLNRVRHFATSRLSPPLRRALREVLSEWRIQRLHEASCRTIATLDRQPPIRLNLASGYHPKQGWINIDLFAPTADLRLDLRRPFPFPDDYAQHIYAEHFFEHLSYPNLIDSNGWEHESGTRRSEALSFLRECLRILEPGGVMDIVVPDAEMILGEYVNRARDGFPAYPWWGPAWCDTPMHCVNYVFRQGREHQYAYDYETLSALLEASGFVEIARRPFDPLLDAANHEIGSLAILARKPRGE